MVSLLFIIAIFIISVDAFVAGTVAGFLSSKIDHKLLFRLQIFLGLISSAVLLIGMMAGKFIFNFVSAWATWYASTLIFLLALKMLYDGLRLHKIKQSINPIDKKGLLAITAMVSINTLFTGLAFGALNIDYNFIWHVLIFMILAVSLGYFAGLKMKKLISLRLSIFSAIMFFIIAIVITIKI